MKKRISMILMPVIAITCAVYLTGCASLQGPEFSKVTKIPEGKAVVYFYRPKAFFGGAVSYDIWLDGVNVPFVHVYNGGYFPYIANPGKAVFKAKTEAEKEVTIEVKAGQSYYVLCSVGVGFWVGRPHLELMAKETAEADIKSCRLLPELVPEKK